MPTIVCKKRVCGEDCPLCSSVELAKRLLARAEQANKHPSADFTVGGSPTSRFVSWQPNKNDPFSNGTASAELIEPGVWWVGRVLVQRSADRCEGIGSRMLAMLCADCAKQPGFVKMLVTPGGYGSDPKRLIEFYSRAGFVLLREMPGALSWSSPSA